MTIRFDTRTDKAEITSNIKDEMRAEVLSDFLRSQMGGGKDKSPANKKDVYEISLVLDLTDDSYRCSHDCGNKGLREGILMSVLQGLE